MPKLDVFRKGSRVSTVLVGPKGVTIGRGDDAEVRLDDPLVSREHARVVQDNGGWVVQDLDTRNGTHVNGVREFRRKLAQGDRIELGPFMVVFSNDESPSPAAGLDWARPAPTAYDDDAAPSLSVEEATAFAGPRELAKLRAESRVRFQPHFVENVKSKEVVHPLREGETLIGSSPRCHVRLAHAGRALASVVKTPEGGFVIRRCGWFFSPVLVNGEKQRQAPLAEGDTISLGEAKLVFRAGT